MQAPAHADPEPEDRDHGGRAGDQQQEHAGGDAQSGFRADGEDAEGAQQDRQESEDDAEQYQCCPRAAWMPPMRVFDPNPRIPTSNMRADQNSRCSAESRAM